MALHPTLSDVHFKKSVMKFIIDQLVTIDGNLVFFEPIFEVPRDGGDNLVDSWIEVEFNEKEFEALASCYTLLNIYTREDSEGFDNSRILDQITEMMTDEDSTNGTAYIPYYDTTVEGAWTQIGGMIPILRRTSETFPGRDSTTIRTVSFELKWGAR